MVFEQVDGELNEIDYSTFSSNLSVLLSPRSVRWDMSNVNISILRSNLSVKGDFVNVTIPKMQLKLVHQQGQFIKTFTRHSVIYKCCYCFHTLTKTIATLICMMASFYHYDQDPSGLCFLVQSRAFVIETSLRLPNLNMKRKSKRTLVVVVKWRHRANGLLLTVCSLLRVTSNNRVRVWAHAGRCCESSEKALPIILPSRSIPCDKK